MGVYPQSLSSCGDVGLRPSDWAVSWPGRCGSLVIALPIANFRQITAFRVTALVWMPVAPLPVSWLRRVWDGGGVGAFTPDRAHIEALVRRYLDGALSRAALVDEITSWDFVLLARTDGIDDVLVDPPGSVHVLIDAHDAGLISADMYDEICDRLEDRWSELPPPSARRVEGGHTADRSRRVSPTATEVRASGR